MLQAGLVYLYSISYSLQVSFCFDKNNDDNEQTYKIFNLLAKATFIFWSFWSENPFGLIQ